MTQYEKFANLLHSNLNAVNSCVWIRERRTANLVSYDEWRPYQEINLHIVLHMMLHKKSIAYYPQGNGLAECFNKIMKKIFRIVANNLEDRDQKLDSILWALRTAHKVATRMTHFNLVYGCEAIVPMEFVVGSLRMVVQHKLSLED